MPSVVCYVGIFKAGDYWELIASPNYSITFYNQDRERVIQIAEYCLSCIYYYEALSDFGIRKFNTYDDVYLDFENSGLTKIKDVHDFDIIELTLKPNEAFHIPDIARSNINEIIDFVYIPIHIKHLAEINTWIIYWPQFGLEIMDSSIDNLKFKAWGYFSAIYFYSKMSNINNLNHIDYVNKDDNTECMLPVCNYMLYDYKKRQSFIVDVISNMFSVWRF